MSREQYEAGGWYHTIELADGTVTPGAVDYRGRRGERFLVPDDLAGCRVLDMGTWDGFWAIEAKKRGGIVVAADRFDPPLAKTKFALADHGVPYDCHGDLDFPMSYNSDDGDTWHQQHDKFEVVLFFGILYHLKNPFMGLWNAASCCKPGGRVIVETAVDQGKARLIPEEVPALWVIDTVHAGDATNYYCPNKAGAAQLCKMAGLSVMQTALVNNRFTLHCLKPETSP